MAKPPDAPDKDAPKREHVRFAREVLEGPWYRDEPAGGMRPSDDVPASEHKKPRRGKPE